MIRSKLTVLLRLALTSKFAQHLPCFTKLWIATVSQPDWGAGASQLWTLVGSFRRFHRSSL